MIVSLVIVAIWVWRGLSTASRIELCELWFAIRVKCPEPLDGLVLCGECLRDGECAMGRVDGELVGGVVHAAEREVSAVA